MESNQTDLEHGNFTDEQKEVIHSIRSSRIVLPILISLGVVCFMLYNQFDPKEFAKISWTSHTWVLFSMALIFVAVRHFAYMARLYILTEGFFSWRKCFELIFVWEFASTITPTSIGGSAVAFLLLSKEKLSMARTAAIVTYTIVLDALFFVISVPIIYFIYGTLSIGADIKSLFHSRGWIILLVYLVIVTYGSLFAYGLFKNPKGLKKFFLLVCKIPFLKRFESKAKELGDEMILASREIGKKSWKYHLGGFMATGVAWLSRFLILIFLFTVFIPSQEYDLARHSVLFARIETFFLLMLYSPSPGGAGFTELFFFPHFQDFIPKSLSGALVFIWRMISYNSYLLIGAIITPNWIRKVINKRREEKTITKKNNNKERAKNKL